MEYKMYYSDGADSVLDNPRDFGEPVVFCDRASDPYKGWGIYEITYRGKDKRGRDFMVANPVLAPGRNELYHACQAAQKSGTWERSAYKARLSVAFPWFHCIDLVSIVKLCNKVGSAKVEDALAKPQPTDGLDFEFDSAWPHDETPYSVSTLATIRYVNGERACQRLSWIYKNREHLVNYQLVVYGNTADNLRISIRKVS